MYRIKSRILPAGFACLLAAQAAAVPVSADAAAPLGTVEFSNVSTELTVGEVPDFTAYLSGDALLHASIINEGWGCVSDMSIHTSKSEGNPVPDDPVGVPYSYLIALRADSGYYFPADFQLIYQDEPIDSSMYTATIQDDGATLMLSCDFIPQVVPLAPDAQEISVVYILDSTLDYQAGDAPRFTAHPADPEQYEVLYERWVDDLSGRFITNHEGLNEMLELTDENRLTAFEANGQYHYDICVTAKYGYVFADETAFFVNGTSCNVYGHTKDTITVNDVFVMVVPDRPAETAVTTAAATVPTTVKTTAATESATTKTTVTTKQTTAKTTVTTAVQTTTEATVPTAKFDPELLYGDVNQDGRVSVSDTVLLLRYLGENSTIKLSTSGLSAADLNLDGMLDMLDVQQLKRLVLKGTGSQQTVIPPRYLNEEDSTFDDLDFSDFKWIAEGPDGNSKAFTSKPVEGLTVSGEENVLSYDGQLRFSDLSDAETKDLCERTAEAGCTMIDGWHVEAGIAPDAHLPGQYACSYDLSTLDIPESMYDQVVMLRLADDGTVQRYATERDGAVLSWYSDQNSIVITVIVWGSVAAVELALIGTAALWYKEYEEQVEATGGCTGTLETPLCNIHYQDTESKEIKEKREKQMRKIEDAAEESARRETGSDLIEGLNKSAMEELQRRTAVRKQQILDDDEKYQAMLEIQNGHPADVVLLARDYEIARDYLYYHERCPKLSYAPDVIFIQTLSAEGLASTPFVRQSYLLLKRYNPSTGAHVQKSAGYWDLYDDIVSSEYADKYLTTITHEQYHLIQNTKLTAQLPTNQKFFEMSAYVIELHCADYFKSISYIKSHAADIGKEYDTYAYPMDAGSLSPSDNNIRFQTDAGYTLGRFWIFIENSAMVNKAGSAEKKLNTGWDMITGYKKYGTISALMNHLFGFTEKISEDDNPNKILDFMWRKYHESIWDVVEPKARLGGNYTGDNKRHVLTPEPEGVKSNVKSKDLACTLVRLQGVKDREFSAVFVRNPDFGELQPAFRFIIPDPKLTKSQETKNGLAVNKLVAETDNYPFLCYQELQGTGALGASGYTIHYIPAPDTPAVTADEEAECLKINLKTAPSKEAAAGMTDSFVLVFQVNGKEVYTQPVSFDDWSKEITVPFGNLRLSMKQKNNLRITVCEQIEAGRNAAGTDCGAFRLAESLPFDMKLGEADFPEVDMDFIVEGSYGSLGISKFSEIKAHFTLNKNGDFTWTIGDHSDKVNEGASVGNPFVSFSDEWSFTGFTVKGSAHSTDGKDIDPSDWSAAITSCPDDKFSMHELYTNWDDKIYTDDDAPAERWVKKTETDLSGSFGSGITGTLHFRYLPDEEEEIDRYVIRLELSPALTVKKTITTTPPGSSTSSEEILKENSIVFQGPMRLTPKSQPGLSF